MDMRGCLELSESSRLSLVLVPLWVSWLLAASLPIALTSMPGWNPQGGWPEVPYLLAPHSTGGHVRSSVYYLVVVATGGVLSAAVIEWSKFLLARRISSSVPYIALSVHQVVTWGDAIRTNAYDWWTYLLHVANVYEIDSWSWRYLHPSLLGRWPWPTAVSALVVTAIIVVNDRAGRRRHSISHATEITGGSP